MKIYFLGTGTSQGIPVIGCNDEVCKSNDIRDKRLRTSVFVDWDNVIFQIDCGPDFRQQMLRSECPHIDALLFTHEHADHTAGIDDIRPFCFMKKGFMDVYGLPRVLQNLQNRFDYAFATENRYPGAPALAPREIEAEKPFCIKGKTVMPINVMHGNLPILGYRFDKLAYLTDVKTLSDETLNRLQGLDILVINALRIKEHPTHNNLSAALEYIQKINPKKAYLTHIGHELGLHEKVEKELPENVFLAYDNLQIEL
ncbi:MBL fold metallo-hydrolase [Avrilella dinanensis]|uniref:MBL fold metallo-hydrolase n=1 Tax=Avrilella dinanensis TaxID=2008672 RepID=UPI002409A158|nr:MBL fold metallo-hydrolase [Avrilella dinanensis]